MVKLGSPPPDPGESGARDELPTRASIFSRLRDRADNGTWHEFFERYWQLIYRAARREGLNEGEAEDVVQEVILHVHRSVDTFRYDPKRSFKGWLLRTTHWRAVDQLRRRRRDEAPATDIHPPCESVPPDLESFWDQEWEQALLRAGLAWLKRQVPADHYQIFDLYFLKKRSVLDVARSLGVAPPTVYVVKHRLLSLLRPELKRLREQPL